MSRTKVKKLTCSNHSPKVDWCNIRAIMLTDNSDVPSDDPAGCAEFYIKPVQSSTPQRCIKTLYQGLKFAENFGIRGGYIGKRDYKNIFFIDDQYLLGIFDDRNSFEYFSEKATSNARTLEDLVELYKDGFGNNKTLIAFEKSNFRLVNSYERGRQTRFMTEVIYPALLGILEWAKATQKRQYINIRFLNYHFLQDTFRNPRKVDKILLQHEPLWFLYSIFSPFNIELNVEGDNVLLPSKTKTAISKEELQTEIRKRLERFIPHQYQYQKLNSKTDINLVKKQPVSDSTYKVRNLSHKQAQRLKYVQQSVTLS